MEPRCPIELPGDSLARRCRRQLENDALAAQARMPDEVAKLERDFLSLQKELQQTRDEFASYRADQAAQYERDRLEQAKINKKNSRRSWAQIVISVILANLVPKFIEYCKLIAVWIRDALH